MPRSFALSEEEFNELMRLCRLYRREARKCMDAKAYLAACILIGAALEADLLAMCDCFADEIPDRVIPKQKNGTPKPLINWTFYQRLRAARSAGWLPAGLDLEDVWVHRKARIGDYAEVVRQIRNLVHASCYITDFPKQRVTNKRMTICYETLEIASDHLQAKVHADLRAKMEAEQSEQP